MKTLLTSLLILIYGVVIAQPYADFTVTDSDGAQHKLYEDYLNQGKVVVMKVFFINCPPCRAVAPTYQAKYVQYGSGTGDVQFFEMSNKTGDLNQEVGNYKSSLGLTMPGVGSDGGALDAIGPLRAGTYGTFFGTPHFSVIAPDGSVQFGVGISGLDDAIEVARQAGGGGGTPPTTVDITLDVPGGSLPSGVSVMLAPEGQPSAAVNLTQVTEGTYKFEYPSNIVPQMQNPILYIDSQAEAYSTQLDMNDISAIRRHIVLIDRFTNQEEMAAADVNGDGFIRASDLVEIRKVLLELQDEFPNSVPSYKMLPAQMPFVVMQGQANLVPLKIIKMGNVR